MPAAKAIKVHKPYPKPDCPVCERPLKSDELKSGSIYCRRCGNTFEAVVFTPPPEIITVKNIDGAGLPGEMGGQAPCAKHALNAADSNCERCGNFMCALCRIELAGKAYCPACFERVLEEGNADLPPQRELFARGIAGMCAVTGFLVPFFGVLVGPVGVWYSIKAIRDSRRGKETAGNITGIVLILLLSIFDFLGGLAFTIWVSYLIYKGVTLQGERIDF